MSSVLIVGATRGLGASLVKQYAKAAGNTVYGTTRSSQGPGGFPEQVKWITGIDPTQPNVGEKLASSLLDASSQPLDSVVSVINTSREERERERP